MIIDSQPEQTALDEWQARELVSLEAERAAEHDLRARAVEAHLRFVAEQQEAERLEALGRIQKRQQKTIDALRARLGITPTGLDDESGRVYFGELAFTWVH